MREGREKNLPPPTRAKKPGSFLYRATPTDGLRARWNLSPFKIGESAQNGLHTAQKPRKCCWKTLVSFQKAQNEHGALPLEELSLECGAKTGLASPPVVASDVKSTGWSCEGIREKKFDFLSKRCYNIYREWERNQWLPFFLSIKTSLFPLILFTWLTMRRK